MVDVVGLGLIFGARVLDVSIGTCRLLLLVRGKRLIASCLAFFEVMTYMVVLGYLMGGGKSLEAPQLIAYCAGYAAGNFVGSKLEELLMRSYLHLEIIMDMTPEGTAMIETLRDAGFGTTVLCGEGRGGERCVVKVVCNRNDLSHVRQIVGDRGVIFVSEVSSVMGGYFRDKRK